MSADQFYNYTFEGMSEDDYYEAINDLGFRLKVTKYWVNLFMDRPVYICLNLILIYQSIEWTFMLHCIKQERT